MSEDAVKKLIGKWHNFGDKNPREYGGVFVKTDDDPAKVGLIGMSIDVVATTDMGEATGDEKTAGVQIIDHGDIDGSDLVEDDKGTLTKNGRSIAKACGVEGPTLCDYIRGIHGRDEDAKKPCTAAELLLGLLEMAGDTRWYGGFLDSTKESHVTSDTAYKRMLKSFGVTPPKRV